MVQNHTRNHTLWDHVLYDAVTRQDRLDLYLDTQVRAAEMQSPSCIEATLASQLTTERDWWIELSDEHNNTARAEDIRHESRRFVGDHILAQNAVLEAVLFEDRVTHCGWWIDVHASRRADVTSNSRVDTPEAIV